MKALVILARSGMSAACAALACASVQAHADVLEMYGSVPRWIAGPNAPANETTGPVLEVGDLTLPAGAVAGLASHRAIIPARYAAKVAELSARFDLSPALIEALVWQESRWRPNAVSPVGARGLAQLMPGTARDLGVDPGDPLANLEGGARYLREQIDRFDGDLEKALAAYNAGPGRVIRAGGIPKIRETRIYVASVMGRLSDHSRSFE